jgi:hypothetical protein
MRDQRNAFWHPESQKKAARPFENQNGRTSESHGAPGDGRAVVASAGDLLVRALDDDVADYVDSVEEWAARIKELLEAGYGAAHVARVFTVGRSTLYRALAAA